MAGFKSYSTVYTKITFILSTYISKKKKQEVVIKKVRTFKPNYNRLYPENSTIYEFKVLVQSDNKVKELSKSENIILEP